MSGAASAEARHGVQLRALCLQQSPAYALDHWGRRLTFALRRLLPRSARLQRYTAPID